MEHETPNGESGHGLEGSGKNEEGEFPMPKHFLSEESISHEQNTKRALEDNESESIGHESDEDTYYNNYMPEHFLSGNSSEMHSAIEQSPKRMKFEDSDEYSEENTNIRKQYDQLLLQSTSKPGKGDYGQHVVDASDKKWPDNLYTLSFASDGNRKRFKYTCNLCGEPFKDRRTCIRHARAHSWEEKPHPCSQCEKAFDKKWFLDRHMKTHEKKREFVCTLCGRDFFQMRHLIDHMQRIHENPKPISTNDDSNDKEMENSDASFYTLKDLQRENKKVIPPVLPVKKNKEMPGFVKQNMENITGHLDDLEKQLQQRFIEHLKGIKQEPANDEQTPDISTSEAATSEDKDGFFMPQHFLSTPDTGMNPNSIKTEESDQGLEDDMDDTDKDAFLTSEHFLSQSINVPSESMDVNNVEGGKAETLFTLTHTYETGRKRVRYSCNVCEKQFKDRRQCVRHIRSHTGEKPFKCHLCGVGFGSDSNLSRHIQTHSGEKPFHCHLCNKYFTQKASLDSHLLLHADPSERPFPCNQCEKAYIKRSQLERHLKTHAEVREFICTVCGKDFSEKRNLLDHARRRHSDKSQPKCEICNREFWSDYHYRMHMRAHENDTSIDAADEEVLKTLPIFATRDQYKATQAQTSSSEDILEKHSLIAVSGLEVNEDGLLVVKKDDDGSLNTDSVDINKEEIEAKSNQISQTSDKDDAAEDRQVIENVEVPKKLDTLEDTIVDHGIKNNEVYQNSEIHNINQDDFRMKNDPLPHNSDKDNVNKNNPTIENVAAVGQKYDIIDVDEDYLLMKNIAMPQSSNRITVNEYNPGITNYVAPQNIPANYVTTAQNTPTNYVTKPQNHENYLMPQNSKNYGMFQNPATYFAPQNSANYDMPQNSNRVDVNDYESWRNNELVRQKGDIVDVNEAGPRLNNYTFSQKSDISNINEDVSQQSGPVDFNNRLRMQNYT